MTQFQEQIRDRVHALSREPLTSEEKAVLYILYLRFIQEGGKVTQLEIARSERWMGCHPKHEADIVANRMDTTTRQVRQIIRDLRVKWEVPIISDTKGYWIVLSQEEATEYVERIELEAKAQIKSWIETVRAMGRSLNATSSFFTNLEAEL